MFVRLLQLLNAPLPIEVTEFGIVMLVKTAALLERVTADRSNAVGDCYVCKLAAPVERGTADRSNGIRYRNACKTAATFERVTADRSNGIRYRNACKAAATFERVTADRSNAIRHRNACKFIATSERIIADGSNGVGESYAYKIFALIKPFFADGGYGFTFIRGGKADVVHLCCFADGYAVSAVVKRVKLKNLSFIVCVGAAIGFQPVKKILFGASMSVIQPDFVGGFSGCACIVAVCFIAYAALFAFDDSQPFFVREGRFSVSFRVGYIRSVNVVDFRVLLRGVSSARFFASGKDGSGAGQCQCGDYGS